MFHDFFTLWSLAFSLTAAPLASAESAESYPDAAHWARAGARVAVPSDLPVAARVAPGDDLQAAVDRVAEAGGGVVALGTGTFVLRAPLNLRSGVTLRGAGAGLTRLELMLRGRFARELGEDGFSTWTSGLSARGVRLAGLENLEIAFEPSLPAPPTLRTHPQAFTNNPGEREDLWVVSVRFTASQDCWLLGCRIVNSGTHPLLIEGSRHITVRACEIAGAHNKGGLGAGYLNLSRSEYTLLERVTVRDIRHLAIQNSDPDFPCRYNVLLGCHLEVDINFHNGDAGHNLVQDCTVAIPPWHWWGPIGVGVPGQHQPPGPGNLFFRCRLTRAYPDPARNFTLADDPRVVYVLRSRFARDEAILSPFGEAPVSGTLIPGRNP